MHIKLERQKRIFKMSCYFLFNQKLEKVSNFVLVLHNVQLPSPDHYILQYSEEETKSVFAHIAACIQKSGSKHCRKAKYQQQSNYVSNNNAGEAYSAL